jgi:hypothetical protein
VLYRNSSGDWSALNGAAAAAADNDSFASSVSEKNGDANITAIAVLTSDTHGNLSWINTAQSFSATKRWSLTGRMDVCLACLDRD